MTSDVDESKFNSLALMLRTWRQKQGLSQMELSELADTTARHVSFIETGRSRPGRGVLIRLADGLGLSIRDKNIMLNAAGFPTEYVGYDVNNHEQEPFFNAVESILQGHSPYPACAVDTLSRIVATNDSFDKLFPGLANKTAEDSIDDFFGPGMIRDMIVNWPELAWAFVDRRRFEAARTNDPRLVELSERAAQHMKGIKRPKTTSADSSMAFKADLRVGEHIVSAYLTVMRYEVTNGSAVSDLRLELIYPCDEASAKLMRELVM